MNTKTTITDNDISVKITDLKVKDIFKAGDIIAMVVRDSDTDNDTYCLVNLINGISYASKLTKDQIIRRLNQYEYKPFKGTISFTTD